MSCSQKDRVCCEGGGEEWEWAPGAPYNFGKQVEDVEWWAEDKILHLD